MATPSPTSPHPHSTGTGLTDSTHSSSSSSSAERYRLDEEDTRPVLCYRYRGGKGLETSSQKEICQRLDKDESLRCTRVPIPPWTSHVNIKRHDLFLPEEKEAYNTFPNYDSNLAAVKIPLSAYFSRMIFGNYDQLYIVSPETTPTGSVKSGVSPSSTNSWGEGSQESVKEGAGQ